METVNELRMALGEKPSEIQEGWRRFVERYRQPLFGHAFRWTDNEDAAKDLVQEVWLRWYRAFSLEPNTLQPDQPILPWLLRACRRLAIDRWRKQRRIQQVELQSEWTVVPDCEGPGWIEDIENSFVFRDLRHCIDALPEEEQRLLMAWLSEASVRNAAAKVGTSRGTLSRSTMASRCIVHDCLSALGWTDEEVWQALND